MKQAPRSRVDPPAAAKTTDFWEGIATSCLLAAVFAFILIREDVTLEMQEWLWLTFVVLAGLSLHLPAPLTLRRLFLMAAPCSVVLFILLAFQGMLQVIWGALYLRLLSWPPVPSSAMVSYVNAGLWYLCLLAGTIPAVIIATFARNQVVVLLKAFWGIDPKRVQKLEKVLNSVIRIIVVALGVIAVRAK